MSKRTAVGAASLFLAASLLASRVDAAPQTGWWWNPAESGRGFFVESHDGITFIGAYLYDAYGHATWLVAGGPNADSYNFTGDLYNKSNGQTLQGGYVAPGAANIVGTLSVHFSDDTHGTLTWPGGTVAIERQIFGTGDPAFEASAGWWWNADQSGSGFSVEIQGANLFVVGFMYDDSGRAVWYYTAGPMNDDATYHGDLLQFANGQVMGGPYKPPGVPARIGTVDLAFDADDEATITFTGPSSAAKGVAHKAGGQSQRSLTPQFPKNGDYVFPQHFQGSTQAVGIQTTDMNGIHTQTQLSFVFLFVDFQQIESDRPGLYDVKSTPGLIIGADQKLTSPFNNCSASLPTTIVPLEDIPHQADFALLVNRHRQYNLTMFVPPGDFNFTLNGECVDSDGNKSPYSIPLAAIFPFGSSIGPIVHGQIVIDKTTTMTAGPITFTYIRRANLHAAP